METETENPHPQDPSRRHTCSYCERGFRKPEHLRRHTRIHTKEKPYRCHCGSSFSRRDLLLRHERLNHQGNRPEAVTSEAEGASLVATAEGSDHCSASFEQAPTSQPSSDIAARLSSFPQHERHHPLYDFYNFLANSSLVNLVESQSSGQVSSAHPQVVQGARDLDQPSLPRTVANSETGAHLAYFILSDPSVQEYAAPNPDFSLPSSQTVRRYVNSFFHHFKLPVIHPSIVHSDSLCPTLVLAMLAIGSTYLFETQKASSFFNASKTIVVKHWTSSKHDRTQGTHWSASALAATFLLLLEYTKLEQAKDVTQTTGIWQSGLIYYLSISGDHTSSMLESEKCFTQWVQRETERRTQLFGCCASTLNTFLFEFLPGLSKMPSYLQLPCPPDAWACPTSDEFRPRQRAQDERMEPLLPWFDNFLSRVDAATAPQLDASALELPYIVAALLSNRIMALSNPSLSNLPTGWIEQQHRLIAKTATDYLLTRQSSAPYRQRVGTLFDDTEALFRLIRVRLAFNWPSDAGSNFLYSQSSCQLASILYKLPEPRPASLDLLIPAISDCVDILEEPATTGIAFFVRSISSYWSVEQLVLAFESALLLCKWLSHVHITKIASQGELELVWRVQALIPCAWSSVDGVDDLAPDLDAKDLALSLVRFWAEVFKTPGNKPFAHLLGENLSEYANMMAHSQSI
ncbi:Regulatory protein ADR1 [Fusarium oxysporum f. sp. rapae]|uniref:Regulatory protein ADR1 n=1 Tax=Fusarium oxysporum f. sp. rapae TaxID=485398 RepID=A0A8J5TMK7_FUSOX|nr:Regulatory protein ADR1 [Fusarium oxysporum f. sp. rapae]